MAKLNKPLFSLSAIGALGKDLIVRRRGKSHVVESKPIPKDAKTSAQLAWRTMYQACTDLWHTLTAAEKAVWESQATPRHMTGYAWYMSQCLRPNPGIYLPLAGGTMSGNIDMATSKILNLPAPIADEEPTRKVDLDTHKALPLAHVGIIPLFHVNKGNSNQNIATGTWTKITWPNEIFDSHGDFSGDKFTPTIPGYYLFIGGFRINSLTANKRMLTALRKNGNLHAYLGQVLAAYTKDIQSVGSFIAVPNGSTDYFELWVYQDSGGAKVISGHNASTFFQGFRIVSA